MYKLEHLQLKRKIKSISRDNNKFLIEKSDPNTDKESRGSARSSRYHDFINKQLLQERDAIGPGLIEKYKLDVPRR